MGTFKVTELFVKANAARYNQAIWKLKRARKKSEERRKEIRSLKARNKRLLRRNARIRGDISDLVYEVCPHCNDEVCLRWDVEERGYVAYCPSCGEKIYLCSKCDKGIEECGACGFGYADDSCFMEVEQ